MPASGSPTLYLYDGFNCIAEYTGSTPTLSKTRTWGLDLSGSLQGAGGVGGLLTEKQDGNYFYPTYDGNGNISEYLNIDSLIVAHYEYDPFGNTVVSQGNDAADFEYRFSTKPLDSETGLYYYLYRYYDPLTGRWPSRDPIKESGGVNLYGFVGNDGVNIIDLLGLNPAFDDYEYERVIYDTCDADGCNKEDIAAGKADIIKQDIARRKFLYDMHSTPLSRDLGVMPAGSEIKDDANSCISLNGYFYRNMKVPKCWICYMEHRFRLENIKTEWYRPDKKMWYDHWWVTCVSRDKKGSVVDELIIDHWRSGVKPGDSPASNRDKWTYEGSSKTQYSPEDSSNWPHKDSSGGSPPIPASDLPGIPTQEETNASPIPSKWNIR